MCLGSREPSEGERLAEELRLRNAQKWGWVVYRCTYSDDEAWALPGLIKQNLCLDIQETEGVP